MFQVVQIFSDHSTWERTFPDKMAAERHAARRTNVMLDMIAKGYTFRDGETLVAVGVREVSL